MIKDIKLGWTTTNDIAKARSFFVDTLGLKETDFNEKFGWLELQAKEGGFTLGIGQKNDHSPYQPGHNTILTFTVDDIKSAKSELEGKGVKFATDIYEVPGHVKLVDFVDNDGNVYQLVQQL